MTPEQREVMVTAITIARSAPARHDESTTYSARIPWYLITALRKNLEDCGIEWDKQ